MRRCMKTADPVLGVYYGFAKQKLFFYYIRISWSI